MKPARVTLAVLSLAVASALASTACGQRDDSEEELPPARPVESAGCSPITYGGQGRPDVLIAASAPLQGQFIDHGVQIVQALKLVLAQ